MNRLLWFAAGVWLLAIFLLATAGDAFLPTTARQTATGVLLFSPLVFFGEDVLGFLVTGVGLGLGWFCILALTFGRARPETDADEHLSFPWYGVARAPDGKIVVSSFVTVAAGLLCVVGSGVVAVVVHQLGSWPIPLVK